MPLPANTQYCTVGGRFIRAILDGTDTGREPDGVALSGLSFTFTANLTTAVVRNASAVPPVMIIIDPITATTNANGALVGADLAEDIVLVASNDPALEPTGWTWTVRMTGPSIAPITFAFVAPAGQRIDLSTVIPVPPSPGSDVRAWQTAVADTLAIKADVQAIAASIEVGAVTAHNHELADTNGLATALAAKAPAASPTFTGTVSGVTKTHVGLGNVDNTSDVNKPVSTAQSNAVAAAIAPLAPKASPTFTGTVSGVTKAMVGLGNVDNTSDASKPISAAVQTALDGKAAAGSGGVSAATMATLVKTPTAWVAGAHAAGDFVKSGYNIFRAVNAHTSSVAPTVANARPTDPTSYFEVWASTGNSEGSIVVRSPTGFVTFKHAYMTEAPEDDTSLVNLASLNAAIAGVTAPPRIPTFALIIWNGSAWTYRDVVITARPGDLLPGERCFFDGLGPIPEWALTSDIVTVG